MIRLSDVVKEYETGTAALKGISLRIEDGAVSYTHLTLPTILLV